MILMLISSTYDKPYSVDIKQQIAKRRVLISSTCPILKGSTIESAILSNQIIQSKIQENDSTGHGRISERFIVFAGVFNSIE